MPLLIVREDITNIKCDAVVDPILKGCVPGCEAEKAICSAAGDELLAYRDEISKATVLKPVITPGFKLPAEHIIHTEYPLWRGGKYGERAALRVYFSVIFNEASKRKYTRVAVPLVTGCVGAMPESIALPETVTAISKCIDSMEEDIIVYLSIPNDKVYDIKGKIFSEIDSYIESHYDEFETEKIGDIDSLSYSEDGAEKLQLPKKSDENASFFKPMRSVREPHTYMGKSSRAKGKENDIHNVFCSYSVADSPYAKEIAAKISNSSILWEDDESEIDKVLKRKEKSFALTLFDYICAKNISEVEAYKRANVTKQTYSKLKSVNHKPSKETVLAFAIALHLTLDETNHLLRTAGMCLSHSDKFDLIVEYFIKSERHVSIHDINIVLDKYTSRSLSSDRDKVACRETKKTS